MMKETKTKDMFLTTTEIYEETASFKEAKEASN